MKILITGSTGFIGKYLVSSFENHNLLLVVRDKISAQILFGDLYQIVEEKDGHLEQIISSFSPEYVYHLAGNANPSDELTYIDELISSNILFATKIFSIISKLQVKLVVNFSTSLMYDALEKKTFNLYAATKSAVSEILSYYQSQSDFKRVDLILYNVYGIGDTSKKAIDYIFESLNSATKIKMSPGLQKLDFIYVEDIIDSCIHLIEKVESLDSCTILHLGTGISTSLKDIAELLEDISGLKCNIEWGGISYRKNEKMISKAPIERNQFWLAKTSVREGLSILLSYKNKKSSDA